MPNWAEFNMRIRGKKEDCEIFKAILYHENEKLFFHRTFPSENYTEGEVDTEYFMEFYGECAWSFLTSMGMVHLYSDFPPSSTVCDISKRLDLSVEIYTTEPNDQFAEHYYCKSGKVLIDECVDYEEYWWDEDECPTIDNFNAEYGTHFTVDDFADGYAWIGGFNSWEWAS